MKNVYVTRRARFNAAHKLWNDEWDAAKNQEVFGKCANPNWHGHNARKIVENLDEGDPEIIYFKAK